MNYVIFGAGFFGQQCLKNLTMHFSSNANVIAFIDNSPIRWNTYVGKIPVMPPATLLDLDFDKIIICSRAGHDSIKKQLMGKYAVPESKILVYLLDPLPIRIDIDSEDTYLASLSEFGLEMIAWLPYLAYLKSRGGKLRTISRKGSAVFYENISDEHIEVDVEYFSVDAHGYLKNLERLSKDTGLKVFALCAELQALQIYINGIEWQVRDFHAWYPTEHLLRPKFNKQNIIGIKEKRKDYRGIVTINNKSYIDGYVYPLRNCFNEEDVHHIVDFLRQKNYFVIYNDFSAAFRETYKNDFDVYSTPINISHDDPGVLYLADYSDGTEDKWDRMQLECWQNSDFVIQHPGGAAAVVELLGIRKFNFMQKGEYQDDLYLAKLYGGQSDTFYEVRHMLAYIEKEISEGRL